MTNRNGAFCYPRAIRRSEVLKAHLTASLAVGGVLGGMAELEVVGVVQKESGSGSSASLELVSVASEVSGDQISGSFSGVPVSRGLEKGSASGPVGSLINYS